MPKSFEIRLEIEEIALGAVLRKLNEMPGIVRLHLDLERGGEGAGRKQLEEAAKTAHSDENMGTRVLKLLVDGPKSVKDLHRVIKGRRQSIYGALHYLRRQGLTESAGEFGVHRLAHKAQAELGLVKALPAPSIPQIKHGPKGHAVRGSGDIVLKAVLSDGPKSWSDIRALAGERGFSAKGVNSLLGRAKKRGLIKKNGSGYELTAKGQKIEMGDAAHG